MFQILWGVILCHLAGQGLGAFGRRRRSQRSRRKKEKKSNTFQQEREVSLKQFGPRIFHASSSQPSWKCFGRLCVCSSILMLAVSKWSQIMCDIETARVRPQGISNLVWSSAKILHTGGVLTRKLWLSLMCCFYCILLGWPDVPLLQASMAHSSLLLS